MFGEGFAAGILLFFTVIIWMLYLLVYISSPKNKVNQWCCICGFLFSVGVFKEYIYVSGMLYGTFVQIFGRTYPADELVNSIMTAVLYYIAMPCVMILSMYFSHLDQVRPRVFRFLAVVSFLPVAAFSVVYPWSQTRAIPVANPEAYVIVASYNLIYGVIATTVIVVTLIREREQPYFRQRRLVSAIGLLPLWYWLITVFLIHLLKLEGLYKLWQGNAFIVLGLFLYYTWNLFHDGIWGMRITREHFDWTEGKQTQLPENTKYIIHMLKNETAKLEMCAREIRREHPGQSEQELDIIDRSISHIQEFVQRSSMYTGEILLKKEYVDIGRIFREVEKEISGKWKGTAELRISDDDPELYCDYYHLKETLRNLAANAVDAMENMDAEGRLIFSYQRPKKSIALIHVSDNGCGIPQEEIGNIFEPFRSSHSDSGHMGLGLTYCRNVIRSHGGYMRVRSTAGKERHGTVFTICLPQSARERRGAGGNKQD